MYLFAGVADGQAEQSLQEGVDKPNKKKKKKKKALTET